MEFFNKIPSDGNNKLTLDKHGKTDRIDVGKPVKDATRSLEENRVNLILSEGFGSSRCRDNKFSNFLKAIKTTDYNEAIAVQKIFDLVENDRCTVELLPFDLDEDMLNLSKRQKGILYKSNLENSIVTEAIGKATYRDALTKESCNPKHSLGLNPVSSNNKKYL